MLTSYEPGVPFALVTSDDNRNPLREFLTDSSKVAEAAIVTAEMVPRECPVAPMMCGFEARQD